MYDYSYNPSTISGYSSALEATSVLATLGAFVGIILIMGLVIGVLQIIGMWKMFTKAGEKGWKSIIPIYNLVILFKISGISPLFVCGYLFSFIPYIGVFIALCITIYQSYNLAKSFGKDAGFTVGLVIFPTIFFMILGFGKAEYVGNNSTTIPQNEQPSNNNEE